MMYNQLLILFSMVISCAVYAQLDDPETSYNDLQYRVIQQGPKVFEQYQKTYLEKYGRMPKLNFYGADLSFRDLRGMNLDSADFRECDLRGVVFGKQIGVRRNLYGNVINTENELTASSLKYAIFSGSDMGEDESEMANFSTSDCTGTDFSDTDLTGALFVETILKDSKFRDASLVGANFKNADMRNSDLSGADVEKCTFDQSIMINMKIEETNMEEAIVQDVFLTEKALKDYLENKKNRNETAPKH